MKDKELEQVCREARHLDDVAVPSGDAHRLTEDAQRSPSNRGSFEEGPAAVAFVPANDEAYIDRLVRVDAAASCVEPKQVDRASSV